MDILAARKKAAERAQTEKKQDTPTAPIMQQDSPAAPEPVRREVVVPAPAKQAEDVPAMPQAALSKVAASTPEIAADLPIEEPVSGSLVGETAVEESAAETEMLAFLLSGEEYVVAVEQVNEVLKMWSLTPVPNAPEHILGVSSLRGAMLTIIDLGKRLGLGPAAVNEKARVVVVTVDDEKVGFIVDRVTGVVKLSPGLVRAVPETVEHGVEFLRGIARKGERLFILLDLDKVAGG